jgi:CRP/FNR family transcriptional regulator, cyclic AMP receptor protein
MDVEVALRACRLFAGLDSASLGVVSAALRPRRFRRGEVIFHIGDPGDTLFVIVSGQAKVTVPADDGSEPAILTTLGPGGFFGELALLDEAPRSATIVAMDAMETATLRRDTFYGLIDSQPDLRRALLASLAGEIRRLTAQVEDLHFLDLPGRLARHLLRDVAAVAGRSPDDVTDLTGSYRLPWRITQAELASMIGGSRQSVNRLLADLVADGTIQFEDDDLVITDVRRLMDVARR